MKDSWKAPIPDMTSMREARRGARAHPLRLDARENHEQAQDVRAHGIAGTNYYHQSTNNPPYFHCAPGSIPELYVREGVLTKLLALNESLKSAGYELFVFDAYRPVEVQNYFHDVWVPAYLRERNPDWSETKVSEETDNYWASGAATPDLLDPLSPPPHATGGVVDLTLRVYGGEPLTMGGAFDDVSSVSFADHLEKESLLRSLTLIEEEALENRRMLYWAMTEAGFTVNPNEWWHFGYGDQMSAKISGSPHAVYSVMPLPTRHD